MSSDMTRREFIEGGSVVATIVSADRAEDWFGDDEEDDESWFDGWFYDEKSKTTAVENANIAIGVKEDPADVDGLDPDDVVFYIGLNGQNYRTIDDGIGSSWTPVPFSGPNPTLDSAEIAGVPFDEDGIGTDENPLGRLRATEADVDSVQTEEVDIGDASPVTGGPIGNQGDWVWLGNVEVLEDKSTFSSTSTTWDGPSWAAGKNPIPLLSDLSATNINIYGELSAEQRHSGSHGQFRLGGAVHTESGFEVSTDGQYSRQSSGRLPLSDEGISGSNMYRFEVKSDDGTEVIYSSVRFWLWGKVQ